ncbi:hypothetical protein PINS_up023616 [Pythium insidiosum]|nr:hypothetical protein PINS_up008345 [Pythium insidiosum]GLE11262.1 hypothetical protein PINS_up023616 [Pythium insidiosum]
MYLYQGSGSTESNDSIPHLGRRPTDPDTRPLHADFDPFESPSHDGGMVPAKDRALQAKTLNGGGEMEEGRFVAGEQFYNYEMYGSLRRGDVVKFISMESFGLVAATFTSVISYQCLQSTARPYMGTQLNLTPQQNVAVLRLVELPMALAFFFGLLSDGYPIRGLRRKGYMVLGLVLNAISVVILGVISAYFESLQSKERNAGLVVLSIIMVSTASVGCIITYICVQTRVIELAQREPLQIRGSIIAEYLVFRRLTSLVGTMFTFATMGKDANTPRVEFSTAMFLLALICALPLPIIIRFWKEEYYNLPTSLKIRGQIFWKIMQQKAVWRILAFIALSAFFMGIRFSDSTAVLRKWSGTDKDNTHVVKSISDLTAVFTILLWRFFFMNTLWRRFFAWAPVMLALPSILSSILTTMDISRDRYLNRVIISFAEVAGGINMLNAVIPLTEIIQEGSEAATMGLVFTIQRVIGIFVNTNAQGLFSGDNFYDPKQIKLDTSAVRTDVLLSLLLNYGINLLALVALVFLPHQKLDAQQLRMYGGFTKAASSAIVIFALSFFLYSLTINVMTFVPSLSCYPLVGGKGCP